ncbi:MAG: hypothetical protein WBB67_11810 [bacterium]
MHLKSVSKIHLGDCYIGLFFFPNIPDSKEITEPIEHYNKVSKHAINACALYITPTAEKHKNSALLITDSGHHLEPLLALSSAWATQVSFIFAVSIFTHDSTEGKVSTLLNKPTAQMTLRMVLWNSRTNKLLTQNAQDDIALLKIISTVDPGLETIRLYPASAIIGLSNQDLETYIFSFSKSWTQNIDSKRTPMPLKSYHFVLSHIAETYRSDLSYLLLRLTRIKSILNMKDVKITLAKQIISSVTGVLNAINERINDFQKRGSQVTIDVVKTTNMFAEIDGAFKAIERLSRTLVILEQIILSRSLGGSFFRVGGEIADDHSQRLILRAIDNVILDMAYCLRGARKYVYGRKPGRVGIGGETYRPLHKDQKELIGQYEDVYTDEIFGGFFDSLERNFDLAYHGVIECYEIPTRYMLRAGSWPLMIHSIVETNEMRLGKRGQYRQIRIVLDLLKWWFEQYRYPLPEELRKIDTRWHRRPRNFPAVSVTEIPEVKLDLLHCNISPDIAKLFFFFSDILKDIVCTRIVGPAYVFALVRFGFRGRLVTLKRQKVPQEDSKNKEILSHPFARLSLCISTLKAEDLLTSSVSDILPTHYLLPALSPQILNEIDNLFVKKPFKKNDESAVQNIIAELTKGHVINERPLLLLNALWYAVIKRKSYVNEPALLFSVAERK